MHLALRTHLYIPDATVIIYTTFQSYCRNRGDYEVRGMAKIMMLVVVRLGSAESSSWTMINGQQKRCSFSLREKWRKEKSTEPTRGQRPCVMTKAFSHLRADLWSAAAEVCFKNHSLNVSISHNFKQLFFFILQQCHVFQWWLWSPRKSVICAVSFA